MVNSCLTASSSPSDVVRGISLFTGAPFTFEAVQLANGNQSTATEFEGTGRVVERAPLGNRKTLRPHDPLPGASLSGGLGSIAWEPTLPSRTGWPNSA